LNGFIETVKRIWKEEKDDVLIEVLKDLVIGGTSSKADNGFKPRFLNTGRRRLGLSARIRLESNPTYKLLISPF